MPEERTVNVGIKLHVNGFPKAGTHLLAIMGAVMLRMKSALNNWLGNTLEYAFSAELIEDQSRIIDEIGKFPPNSFTKGHMVYTPEVAEALQKNKICAAFIFRDFRDVAVSAAYHAQSENDSYVFPEKEFYQGLEFGEVLKRIITGDENIAGVMERWEQYAPWLDEGWVLKLAYEDCIEYPEEVAGMFLKYLYGRTAKYYGVEGIEIDQAEFSREVRFLTNALNHPEMGATFREGKVGKWKEYFTDEHKALFKASDKNNWLIKLGYENDRNW